VKTDAKRNEIIDIAREIFLAEGYSRTSMASIAAKVGGSKATLYGYFRSKQELFGAVVQAVGAENIIPVLDSLDVELGDFDDTLDRIALALVGFFLHPQAIASYRLVVAESARFPELGRAFYEYGRKQGQDKVAAWLSRQMSLGRLQIGDADVMSEQFAALCEIGPARQILLGTALSPSRQDVEKLAKTAVSTFLSAYKA
jgi:AcrR family transcriptional regulator